MIRVAEGDGYYAGGGYGVPVAEEDTSSRLLKAGATLVPRKRKFAPPIFG